MIMMESPQPLAPGLAVHGIFALPHCLEEIRFKLVKESLVQLELAASGYYIIENEIAHIYYIITIEAMKEITPHSP